MRRHGLKVRIIGAGTGGLCLAQGLKKDHVEVEVYERDHSPSDRLQGYRLSISETGRRALKACLPEALFEKLIENSAKPSEIVSFLDHKLNRLLVIDLPHSNRKDATSELPISRIALRCILIEGLGDVIQYGKKFVAFEDAPHDAVTARFEDGSSTTGDVLVGADGAGSRLRVQLLPQARRVETGIVAVSGKINLDDDIRRATPLPILRGPTLILGPRGCFMFSSTVDYEDAALPANVAATRGQDAIAAVIALMDNWHPKHTSTPLPSVSAMTRWVSFSVL
jgi:2-polyprenyl-6-methoxyphenol hydroxylase-like FAD-dependent oxidoreductase